MYEKRKPDIKPLAGWVVINPIPVEEKTDAGIILLNKNAKLQRGTVVAVGKALEGLPQQIKYMDNVVFQHGTGIKHSENGHEYLLLRHKEILMIL